MKKMLFVLLGCILLVACISETNQSAQKEILIGCIAPLTGDAEYFGQQTINGYNLAVEKWNATGGVLGKKIKLYCLDDEASPEKALTVFKKLIQNYHVHAVVGSVMSKCSLPGARVCQSFNIPMISPTSTNPEVTAVGDCIFRACFIDPYQGILAAKFLFINQKISKVACLYNVDNLYSRTMAEQFQKQFKALGGTITAALTHASGLTVFSELLKKILATKPEALFISDYFDEAVFIMKQARELGFKGTFIGGDGWDSPDLIKLGGAAVENCFFVNHCWIDDPDPLVAEFVKSYIKKYDEEPSIIAILAYDAITIMLEAIKRAGTTDAEAIKAQLRTGNFNVVSGEITFDQERNPIKQGVIITIQNGVQRLFAKIKP